MPSRRENKTLTKTQQRKKEHLELCLDTKTVSAPTGSGLDSYTFVHNALPDLDIDSNLAIVPQLALALYARLKGADVTAVLAWRER